MGFPIRGDLPAEGSRQDQFALHFEIELAGNRYDMGYWDKKTGGELDSDEVKYFPGAANVSVSLGGRILPGNVTIQRIYDRADDHIQNRVGRLLEGVGRAKCTIWQRPYDLDGNLKGNRFIWKGTLKRVLIPDVDSEATGAALIECEITTAGGSPDFTP
jgi:hypothetical protein